MAAAGRDDRHLRQPKDAADIPTIGIDYAFFCDDLEAKEQRKMNDDELMEKGYTPMLIGRDSSTKAMFSDCVQCKGINDAFAVDMVTKGILQLGHPKVMLRSDGEPAIKSLRHEVARRLKAENVQVVPNTSVDSASAGLAESGVGMTKTKCRVLVAAAREMHGVAMKRNHPALP